MRHLVLVAALSAAACDPSATASTSDRAAGEQISRAFETCGTSLHCDDGLRCVEGTCREPAASVLGDYYAAVGERELARDNVAAAVESYTRAVNQYKVEEVPVPASLYCAQGHALTADHQNPENAELAARVLHRCVRDIPAWSHLRRRALADLAVLGDVGLDPLLLATQEDADRYLTKAPRAPSAESVAVKAEGKVRTSSSSYSGFLKKIESDEVREQLLPCWEAHFKETKEKTVSVSLPFKYYFYEGVYADQDRYKLTIQDKDSGGGVKGCVREVIEPVADEYSKSEGGSGRWSGEITITLGD